MYGEGNWKADEEYRRGVAEFSRTPAAEPLGRETARGLEPDMPESKEKDVAESARRGAPEEPEW
jgi:hypothetical protein